jgi:hypothetical protein
MFLKSDEIGPAILHAFCPRCPPVAKGYGQTVDVDTNLYAGQLPNLAPTPCGQLRYKPKVFCQWNTRIRETFSFSN